MLARGFKGPVFMTRPTRREMQATLENYARLEDLKAWPASAARIEEFVPGDIIGIGNQTVSTGHSGHVAGGVWFCVESGQRTTLYCGDVVPESAVFPFTELPPCDVLILDCSYGPDTTSGDERARSVIDWVAAHRGGCVLPTPLSGRSLELLAILPGPLAIGEGMEAPLREQISEAALLRPGLSDTLAARIDGATRWQSGEALPDCPLLVHDGMGTAGPARPALEMAEKQGRPVLLSGHLPEGSPGHRMHAEGKADWHRLPTHPTLPQNTALWRSAGCPPVLGHSCDIAALEAMQQEISALDVTAQSGASRQVGQEFKEIKA